MQLDHATRVAWIKSIKGCRMVRFSQGVPPFIFSSPLTDLKNYEVLNSSESFFLIFFICMFPNYLKTPGPV